MAVSHCAAANNGRPTSVTIIAICLCFYVGINLANGSSDELDEVFNTSVEITTDIIGNMTGATFIPPTSYTAHTLVPPPSTTTAPPGPGGLCGTQQSNSYDLTTLTAAPYWTFSQSGTCFDTFGSKDIICEFQLAFCKQLPPHLVDQKTGIGAAQVSTQPGAQKLMLGGLSAVVQNTDENALQLVVSYLNGDGRECGRIQVELHLHCDHDAVWPTPIQGNPGKFPTASIVALDKKTCKYIIETNFSGACSIAGLSAGTVLIIMFFCFVTAYLIGGVIYNKFTGARGLELIPNYDMWKMFPSDVLGGVTFTVSVITCQTSSKSEAYDNL